MSIIKNIFGGGVLGKKSVKERSINIKKTAQRNILYDAELIDDLINEHHELVSLFDKVWSEGYRVKEYSKISNYLSEFNNLFQDHLLKENLRFYGYVELTTKHDPKLHTVMRDFRKDMNAIAYAVVGFCEKYMKTEFDDISLKQFAEDYKGIKKALLRRIETEEQDLYSLYKK